MIKNENANHQYSVVGIFLPKITKITIRAENTIDKYILQRKAVEYYSS